MTDFREIDLIKLNIVILGLLLSASEFSEIYSIEESVISTGALGFLITIIGFYLFHIRKMERDSENLLILRYILIVYINILSIVYLVIGISLDSYTKIDASFTEPAIVISTVVLLIGLYSTFRKKSISSDAGLRFDRFKIDLELTLFCRLIIESIIWTLFLIGWYISVEYLIV